MIGEFVDASAIHAYRTRHRDLLRIPLAKTTKYQGSFRINGARAYNLLPKDIRMANTIKEFKIKTTRHYRS